MRPCSPFGTAIHSRRDGYHHLPQTLLAGLTEEHVDSPMRSIRVELVDLVWEVVVVYEIGWPIGVEQVAIDTGSGRAQVVSGVWSCFREKAQRAEGAGRS
jgi:hypothetical protein